MIAAIFICLIIFTLTCIFCRVTLFKSLKYHNESKKIKPPYAVLSVKNCEDSIEGVIRLIVRQLKTQSQSCTNCIESLVIIDLGSDDETHSILEKLANEYPCILLTDKKQYIETISAL